MGFPYHVLRVKWSIRWANARGNLLPGCWDRRSCRVSGYWDGGYQIVVIRDADSSVSGTFLKHHISARDDVSVSSVIQSISVTGVPYHHILDRSRVQLRSNQFLGDPDIGNTAKWT